MIAGSIEKRKMPLLAWAYGAVVLGFAALAAFLSWDMKPGWASWVCIVPACAIVLITALVRANDIGPDQLAWNWIVRKLGFCLAGIGACLMVMSPMYGDDMTPRFPSWRAVIIVWGLALTWLTTPNQPPWWRYIMRGQSENYGRRKGDEQQ